MYEEPGKWSIYLRCQNNRHLSFTHNKLKLMKLIIVLILVYTSSLLVKLSVQFNFVISS